MSTAADRRTFLATAGAMAAGGCVQCRLPPAPGGDVGPLADAHAHFFNAADLPVAGFARFVLIPRYIGDVPDVALALVDIIAAATKFLTLTASEEMQALGRGRLSMRDAVSAEDFARVAARAHRAGLDGRPLVDLPEEIESDNSGGGALLDRRQSGHRRLAQLLGNSPAIARGDTARAPALDEAAFIALLQPGLPMERAAAGPTDGLQCGPGQNGLAPLLSKDSVAAMLRWFFIMMQPRCRHVFTYLDTIKLAGHQVTDAINLLVDYDAWLGDAPRPGSSHAEQVAYWTRYADVSAAMPSGLRLHSFAGYDPLVHAEQLAATGASPYFARLSQWAVAGSDRASRASHRVTGFKLYPPMGFRPDDNQAIDIPATAANGRAIMSRWARLGEPLGRSLDTALAAFFKLCLAHDIPLMTHGRESNIALPGHGRDAEPARWLHRARQLLRDEGRGLRLCIGHFDLVNCTDADLSDRAAMIEALKLNRSAGTNIFFDIGFDENILAGGDRAREFFTSLAQACEAGGDLDGAYVMFGSDWIMLGNQENAPRFLANAWAASEQVEFWRDPARRERLFRTNMLRFLKQPIR